MPSDDGEREQHSGNDGAKSFYAGCRMEVPQTGRSVLNSGQRRGGYERLPKFKPTRSNRP
jgi:hypothetical protein